MLYLFADISIFFKNWQKFRKQHQILNMNNFKTLNLLKMINSLLESYLNVLFVIYRCRVIFLCFFVVFLCLLCCVFKVVFTTWMVTSTIIPIGYFICQHVFFPALLMKNAYISINCFLKWTIFLIYNTFWENEVIMT